LVPGLIDLPIFLEMTGKGSKALRESKPFKAGFCFPLGPSRRGGDCPHTGSGSEEFMTSSPPTSLSSSPLPRQTDFTRPPPLLTLVVAVSLISNCVLEITVIDL